MQLYIEAPTGYHNVYFEAVTAVPSKGDRVWCTAQSSRHRQSMIVTAVAFDYEENSVYVTVDEPKD